MFGCAFRSMLHDMICVFMAFTVSIFVLIRSHQVP
jgi:hypothetical protein